MLGTLVGHRPSMRRQFLEDMLALETDECILWPFALKNGYGEIRIKNKSHTVHRLALLVHVGEPSIDKNRALHKPIVCHTARCFNYRHLYWGSPKDNMADAIQDETTTRGEKNSGATLAREQVLAIRQDERSLREIAEEYGIKPNYVSRIRGRERWGWLE